MMANGGGGGDFSGEGSVRWEIVTTDDDGDKLDVRGSKLKVVEEVYHDRGRRNAGVDKHHHDDFRIIMKVPEEPRARAAFLAQFKVQEQSGYVEVRLPIAKVPKQVQIRWTDSKPAGKP
jgi:hypothetical protein